MNPNPLSRASRLIVPVAIRNSLSPACRPEAAGRACSETTIVARPPCKRTLRGGSRLLCARIGPEAVKRNKVHALRRCPSELAQQRRHLPPVIAGVVDHVLQHLPENRRAGLAVDQRVLE